MPELVVICKSEEHDGAANKHLRALGPDGKGGIGRSVVFLAARQASRFETLVSPALGD